MTYYLYTRRLSDEESASALQTHEHRELTAEQFLKILPLVDCKRNSKGQIIVGEAWTSIFLYRLGGVQSIIDAFSNEYDENIEVKLRPWPLGPSDNALVIERMEFLDGYYTGRHVRGKFTIWTPRAI